MNTRTTGIALLACTLLSLASPLPNADAATAVAVPDSSTLPQVTPSASVLGYEFVSSQTLTLTALGIFDENNDGISSAHTVAIWDDAGNVVTQQLFAPGAGALAGGFRFIEVAPINLTADIKYIVGVFYFGNNDDPVVTANSSDQYALDSRLTILGGRSRTGGFGAPNTETSDVYLGPNHVLE